MKATKQKRTQKGKAAGKAKQPAMAKSMKKMQKRLPAASRKMEIGDHRSINSSLGMTLIGSAALAAITFILTQSGFGNPIATLFS